MNSKAAYYRAEEARAASEERYEDAARWRDRARERDGRAPNEMDVNPGHEGISCFIPSPGTGLGSYVLYAPLEWFDSLAAPEPNPYSGDHGWVRRMQEAAREALNAALGREVNDWEVRQYGFRVINQRTGLENFFFEGRCYFVVNHSTGTYGPPADDNDAP